MIYSKEPMEGIGILKISVREGNTLVIGQLVDAGGRPLGIQAETRIHTPETVLNAVNRVRERIRQKIQSQAAEVPQAGNLFYTGAWQELQRRWPDQADRLRRLNIERWDESTLMQTVSYLKNQILPRLDRLGCSPIDKDISALHDELVEQASNSKNSLGLSDQARSNLIGKLRRCDVLYRQIQVLLPDWHLPDLDLRMEGQCVSNLEQCKSLPEPVRIRLAALLALLIPTQWGGAALCLAFMLMCGLRTAESAALYFRDLVWEKGIELFWVAKQREGTELTGILKTENAYRRLPLTRFLSDMVEMRRAWLREQGYTNKQIQDMPLNGRPKDPGLPIDTGAISAVGRQLLIICGCRERSYWDGVRTLMADDPDTTVSGSRLMDVTAYILRRDFASWVSNVCAIPKQELDIAMGHKVKVSMNEKRAFYGIESMLRFRRQLERYVFDPNHSDHPAFSPVTVAAEHPGSLPAYGKLQLVAAEDMEIQLYASALDAWQPLHIQVNGGKILRAANISLPDLPEERHTRPLLGETWDHAFYEQLIAEARSGKQYLRKAEIACEEVL